MNTRNPHTHALFKRRLAAAVAGLMLGLPAFTTYADTMGAHFTVSVRVINHCRLMLPDSSLPPGQFALSCTRGTGYQVLVDDRPDGSGAGNGNTRILPLPAAAEGASREAGTVQPHWLTILY